MCHAVRSLPTGAQGRGTLATSFETMAIAALRAGEREIGRDLVERARAAPRADIPDEHVELAIAGALLAGAGGALARCAARAGSSAAAGGRRRHRSRRGLEPARALHVPPDPLRDRRAARRHAAGAGAHAHLAAAARGTRAHGLARALPGGRAADRTDPPAAQARRKSIAAPRHRTRARRARSDQRQLSRKMAEVQALQAALHEQAVRDCAHRPVQPALPERDAAHGVRARRSASTRRWRWPSSTSITSRR